MRIKCKFKKFLKNTINMAGYEINRTESNLIGNTYGRMAIRDIYHDIMERIKSKSPLIIDGGANCGDTIRRYLSLYQKAIIYAFEPIPECANILRKKFSNKNIVVHEVALGAEKKKIYFNVTKNLVSSSIYNISEISKNYHGKLLDVKETIEVQQICLDEIIKDDVDILKLDLQGYELNALVGCKKLLKRIKIVTMEIEFVPLYDDQPLFAEIDIFMRNNNFKLLNLYNLYTHPDAQLTSGDAIYLNCSHF